MKIQQKKKNKNKKKNKKKQSLLTVSLKFIFTILLAVLVLGLVIGGAVFYYYAKDAPKLDMAKIQSQPSTVIYDKDNNVIAQLGTEQRELVQPNAIPSKLVDAVTSIEDHRFFNTRGVDPIRIGGSLIHNIQSTSVNGGSTLDMQLIKLSFFSTDKSDQTLRVKVQEAWMAVELNQKYSKEEIFTAYVNKVNMANGYYGMGTASKAYYGKSLNDLSTAQIALLAGMPQAPTTYNPYVNPDAAKYRRDLVINAMYKYGKISESDKDRALATPITDGLIPLKQSANIPAYADNYLKQVVDEANQETGEDVTNAGLKIYTGMDSTAQQNLYNIINTSDYIPFPNQDLQVASTVVNTQTGAVVAQVGGRNQPAGVTFGFNQAVQTDRDWGSSMKPIVDYGPAFENGVYNSTGNYVSDTGPYYYPNDPSTQLNDWDNLYMGNLTVRQALALSRNIPAVKTLNAVGLDNSSKFVSSLGINFDPLVYSNAISSNTPGQGGGSDQYGASSLKMAAAYGAFSNNGIYTKPYYVTKIVYPNGKEVDYKPQSTQVMKPSTAYAITSILKDVISGGDNPNIALSTGRYAQVPGLPSAGKTGTSNYTDDEYKQALANAGYPNLMGGSMSPDELFAGYTPQYAMATWEGYKNRLQPIYGDTMYIPARVFKAMMTTLYPNPYSVQDWTMPSNMVQNGNQVSITDGSNSYKDPARTYTPAPSPSSSVPSTAPVAPSTKPSR